MLEHNLDGTTTEYFATPTGQPELLALLRDVFEVHWREVIFGPCIEGAVFEARYAAPPRLTVLDGYATIAGGADQPWHLHLCIGPHVGTAARPTPPELARWRRCGRAAFFRDTDRNGRQAVWGFRMWNGRNEQMLTVFFPNPWLGSANMRPRRTPNWSCLATWMHLRARHAGVPAEPPPADETPPQLH